MNTYVQELIQKSNLLNQEITEKCRITDQIIKDITLAYRQPVSANCSFVVSFVGRFKTGKSSLINALIGADVLPTKATTATSVVTRIFYGKSPKCWVRNETEDKEISFEEGNDIILNYKVTNVNKPVEVIFELPIPWIKGNIELRDTPGMDDSSQDGKLETIAMDALKDTDLCVCVYDACALISETERTRTQKIHKMMSGNVVYAINCINRLNSMESLNQVKRVAMSFFGSMHSSTPNTGKYYMVCSAPKMIRLDGFDKWLQDFVSENNLPMLNRVRNNVGIGQVSVIRDEFIIEAQYYSEELEQQIATLTEKHEEIIMQKQHANKQAAQNEADAFSAKVANLSNLFVDISYGLREKIQECKGNETEYGRKTKAETLDYFIRRYSTIIKNYSDHFSETDVEFIKQAFQCVTFPGIHTKSNKSTSGEKTGWAAAGVGIGWLIAGPIGAAVAGAIGLGIGATDTTVDDSVENTMSFINSNVIPLMKKSINKKISAAKTNIKNIGNQNCNSELETIIFETKKVQKMLKNYYSENG